jgi:hypothetical protein
MRLNKLYISYKKALNIPILFSSRHETVAACALVDSGAMENFLDYRMTIQWRVKMQRLAKPREVFNVDGTQNKAGIITESCMLRVEKDQHSEEQRFFITNLGANRVLLGYPWLHEFNLWIDWAKATVEGGQVHLKEQGVRWHEWRQQRLAIKRAQTDKAWEMGDEVIICKTNFTQEWAIEANKNKWAQAAAKEEVPTEYRRHTTVFSEIAAKHFPLARPEDHAIKLKPNAPQTINCKVYPLTHAEREAMAKFLRENKALQYIEKTDSPWSTPWFFIKKKDGTLCPI